MQIDLADVTQMMLAKTREKENKWHGLIRIRDNYENPIDEKDKC